MRTPAYYEKKAAEAKTKKVPHSEIYKLRECLRDALKTFKVTQNPAHYPKDDWVNRAIELLGEDAAKANLPEERGHEKTTLP
jgi:hypothetical protein